MTIKPEVVVCKDCGYYKCLCKAIDKAIKEVKAMPIKKP